MTESDFPDLEYFKEHTDYEKTINEIFRKATRKYPHLYEEYKNSDARRAFTLNNLYHAWYLQPWTIRNRIKLHIKPGPSHIKDRLLMIPEHLKQEYEQRMNKRDQERQEKKLNKSKLKFGDTHKNPPVEQLNVKENTRENCDKCKANGILNIEKNLLKHLFNLIVKRFIMFYFSI